MAGGILLSNLTDLFLATSQAVLTGENFMLHESQKRNTLLKKIMGASDMVDMVQGGDTITDQIIFDEDNTGADYAPMESFTPRLGNHLKEISIDWKFTKFDVTFSKHEKGLNMAGSLNKGARSMVFKKIIKAKYTNLWVSVNNFLERQFFATPNVTTMETAGGKTPLSLFCTLTEFGAVSTDAKPVGTVPAGFTTVQGVNPTTFPKWKNPVQFYAQGASSINVAGNRWDGFSGIRRLVERLKFEELAIRPEFGEAYDPEGFIMCSLAGKSLWELATARLNDQTRHGPSNAAYPGLNFDGIPLTYVEQMDFAAVWTGGTATTSDAGEFNATTDDAGGITTDPDTQGPRYVVVVPKYWRKIIHSDHFLEEETPPPTVAQPFSRTVYYDCWHNNFNRSRQRAGGIMKPSASILISNVG